MGVLHTPCSPCTPCTLYALLRTENPRLSQALTDLGPLGSDPGHGWGALGQLGDGPLRDPQGAAIGGVAEDGQADLLLGMVSAG